MVSAKSVQQQLKKLGFKTEGWGKGEVHELHNILLPGEEIYEVVNGIYEGGFALLLATDVRVLLVDHKPLNYLTVEDLRFDMINEIDYSHRLLGARISVATGNRDLKFLSYNQNRLRKLIGHVQHCMAEAKKKQSTHSESQSQHLERINQQLHTYLMAQQQYQLQLQQMQQAGLPPSQVPEPPRPDHELSDYLLAQRLLSQHNANIGVGISQPVAQQPAPAVPAIPMPDPPRIQTDELSDDLYADGLKEVFGKPHPAPAEKQGLEINPMRIAYSKLPMALRSRKFGRPRLHAPVVPEPLPTPLAD